MIRRNQYEHRVYANLSIIEKTREKGYFVDMKRILLSLVSVAGLIILSVSPANSAVKSGAVCKKLQGEISTHCHHGRRDG